jgi:NAD(P)-dependent dehydrogenase (short-subunit alcohol dehydrogenase family)
VKFVVTGASSGIGRAIAVRLAERGHEVVAGVRRGDAPAYPGIRPMALDVTDPAQLAAAAEDVGSLDGLVNNAGVAFSGPLEYLPLHRLRRQLEVNVVGLDATTQAFLPAIRAGRGRIVMISSAAGRITPPLLGGYSASKFAVEALSDALRQELAPWGVPVVVIEPGNYKSRGRADIEAAAAADRATMSEEAERRYGPDMDALSRYNDAVEAGAEAPDRVAVAVERALTRRRPRARYLVGADAVIPVTLSRLLPARAMDALLARIIGLSGERRL